MSASPKPAACRTRLELVVWLIAGTIAGWYAYRLIVLLWPWSDVTLWSSARLVASSCLGASLLYGARRFPALRIRLPLAAILAFVAGDMAQALQRHGVVAILCPAYSGAGFVAGFTGPIPGLACALVLGIGIILASELQ